MGNTIKTMKKIKNLFWILLIFTVTIILSSCSEYPITPIEQKPQFGLFRIGEFSGEITAQGDTLNKLTIYCNGKIERIVYY